MFFSFFFLAAKIKRQTLRFDKLFSPNNSGNNFLKILKTLHMLSSIINNPYYELLNHHLFFQMPSFPIAELMRIPAMSNQDSEYNSQINLTSLLYIISSEQVH